MFGGCFDFGGFVVGLLKMKVKLGVLAGGEVERLVVKFSIQLHW